MYREPPGFLAGTFRFSALGYRYSEAPPLDLMASEALDSENPWIALAAVLEHAKTGHWSLLRRVPLLMDPSQSPLLVGSCFRLLGDVGSDYAIELLQSLLRHESSTYIVHACQALHHIGYLSLVRSILQAWERLRSQDDREVVALILSEMLEEQRGPLSSCTEYTSTEYSNLVGKRSEELRSQLGAENVPVWGGRPFGVVSLVHGMIRKLKAARTYGLSLDARFLDLRERFEASTGSDCSGFFVDARLQVPVALAILQTFLRDPGSDKYQEGMRYFFGHPVPLVTPR